MAKTGRKLQKVQRVFSKHGVLVKQKCNKCCQLLDVSEFGITTNNKHGIHVHCRLCANLAAKIGQSKGLPFIKGMIKHNNEMLQTTNKEAQNTRQGNRRPVRNDLMQLLFAVETCERVSNHEMSRMQSLSEDQ